MSNGWTLIERFGLAFVDAVRMASFSRADQRFECAKLLLGNLLQAESGPILEESPSISVKGGQVLGRVGFNLLSV